MINFKMSKIGIGGEGGGELPWSGKLLAPLSSQWKKVVRVIQAIRGENKFTSFCRLQSKPTIIILYAGCCL